MALAITLTLALRPVGAFVFGRLADRYGRRRHRVSNAVLQTSIAVRHGGDLALALAAVAIVAALAVAALGLAGPEARHADLAGAASARVST